VYATCITPRLYAPAISFKAAKVFYCFLYLYGDKFSVVTDLHGLNYCIQATHGHSDHGSSNLNMLGHCSNALRLIAKRQVQSQVRASSVQPLRRIPSVAPALSFSTFGGTMSIIVLFPYCILLRETDSWTVIALRHGKEGISRGDG
jgi:hypothetical protein